MHFNQKRCVPAKKQFPESGIIELFVLHLPVNTENMMKYEINHGRLVIHTAGRYRNKTVEDFLNEYCQSDRNQYLLIQNRQILVNDEPVRDVHQKLTDEDITLLIPEEEYGWPCADQPCNVIYEDAFCYIVHKDAGYIIHDDANPEHCLMAMAAKWQDEHGIHVPVRPIHRLDRDTQGLVFFSKIPFFQPWFDRQLSEKKIQRHYLAIVKGKCPQDRFTCNGKIGRDRHRNGAFRISSTGQEACTKVEKIAARGPYTLLGCTLETGRTHQIRVHLADKGLPIVNDPLYGVKSKDFRIMGLWADEIEFRSPLTNKKHKIHDIPVSEYDYFKGEK